MSFITLNKTKFIPNMKYDMNKTQFEVQDSSMAAKYNLILSNKGRYLEVSSAVYPSEPVPHVPTINFDRLIKRDSFLNSGPNVNEHRFELLKEPEIWTKFKRIQTLKMKKNNSN